MLLLLISLLLPAYALSQTGSWDFPKPYEKNSAGFYLWHESWDVWHPGDTLELRWNTTLSDYNIVMQQARTGLFAVILRQSIKSSPIPIYLWLRHVASRQRYDDQQCLLRHEVDGPTLQF